MSLVTDAPSADLIEWPEGLKPKRGVITKTALLKLKVADLRQALLSRGLTSDGKKEELVEVLLSNLASSSSPAQPTSHASSSSSEHHTTPLDTSPANHTEHTSTSPSTSSSEQPPSTSETTTTSSPADTTTAARGGPASTSGRYDVPPFPVSRRGHSYNLREQSGFPPEEIREILMANSSEMMLTLLGSVSGLPTGRHHSTSIALIKARDTFIFDAGDDTQRQLLHERHIKPSKIFRLFITARSADKLLGLPGLLCVLGAAKILGHENADIPIHLYGPPGLADYLATVFEVSNTYLEVPIVVNEFVQTAVSEEDQQPTLFNRRAKVWRAKLPPDQLNPQGWVNGDLTAFMPTAGRGTVKKGRHSRGGVLSMDSRAGFKPLPLPPPGDPSRTGLSLSELTWTIAADESCSVTAVALPADVPALGYILQEADRAGKLSVERCNALNLRPGKSYGLLKDGVSVENLDGVMIEPADVVSPDKPGRKVAILLNTRDASAAAKLAQGADVVVHDAVGLQSQVGEVEWVAGRAAAADAGRFAASVGARHLLLANMDGRLCGEGRQAWLQALVEEARGQFGGDVSAGRDFFTLYMERHEGPDPALPRVMPEPKPQPEAEKSVQEEEGDWEEKRAVLDVAELMM